MGFPLEHGLQATLMATELCEVLGVDDDVSNRVYYGSMLMYSGCNSEAALGGQILSGERSETLIPHLFGSRYERVTSLIRSIPPPEATRIERVVETTRKLPRLLASSEEQQAALCEVAEMLSRRIGLPPDICGLFDFLTERWDGKSVLRRADGDDIPLAVRIFILARDVAFQRQHGGEEHALRVARGRAGQAFDPDLTAALLAHADRIFGAADVAGSTWEAVLDAEPKPWLMLEGDEVDAALAAIGDFSDLVSPSLSSHSESLAALVSRAARIADMGDDEVLLLRRAALVHDVGRVAVDPGVWEKSSPLNRDEQEKIRLHPYHTERILSQSPFLEKISQIARDHHEHVDGTGYHRGVAGASLSPPARLLAAADAFQSLTESRPDHPPRTREEAARELARLAEDGSLDHDMVAAVIEAAGEEVPEMDRPAGLTGRETEVIGLLARGLQTKQVATALGISPKTADTHIQSAYRKMGVSTRAAATLFAMEHGLVPSGELPIRG